MTWAKGQTGSVRGRQGEKCPSPALAFGSARALLRRCNVIQGQGDWEKMSMLNPRSTHTKVKSE